MRALLVSIAAWLVVGVSVWTSASRVRDFSAATENVVPVQWGHRYAACDAYYTPYGAYYTPYETYYGPRGGYYAPHGSFYTPYGTYYDGGYHTTPYGSYYGGRGGHLSVPGAGVYWGF